MNLQRKIRKIFGLLPNSEMKYLLDTYWSFFIPRKKQDVSLVLKKLDIRDCPQRGRVIFIMEKFG